jgi:hypothetical protein
MLKLFPTIFTIIGCPKKSDFDQFCLRNEHVFQVMANYQTKWSKSDFFGTPYDGKNGWKQLKHTFLDQPTHILFHELCSWQITRQKWSKSDFLGHPMMVIIVGNNFSKHSWTNQTHFVL